jgi:hypothetical protein
VRTGLGDIRVDLRALRTDAEVVELEPTTVIGDVDVVVAAGVDVEPDGRTVMGDRRVELTPVPRPAGTPPHRRAGTRTHRRPTAAQPRSGRVGRSARAARPARPASAADGV